MKKKYLFSSYSCFCLIHITVKLSGPEGMTSSNGTVLYYVNDTWSLMCDDDFDDITARQVCREIGFADGRAVCCSAYGAVNVSVLMLPFLRVSVKLYLVNTFVLYYSLCIFFHVFNNCFNICLTCFYLEHAVCI